MEGIFSPSGLPRWEQIISLAFCFRRYRMVGKVWTMRLSSPTLPFFIGTLKSTRKSTRFPFRSAFWNLRMFIACRLNINDIVPSEDMKFQRGFERGHKNLALEQH